MVEDVIDATLDEKIPDEKDYVNFDFTGRFKTGVTIVSAATFATAYSGTDDSAQNTISGAAVVEGMVVSQFTIGGVDLVTYKLRCHAIGSDGAEQDIVLLLPVNSGRLG